jgi:hypothetical protein
MTVVLIRVYLVCCGAKERILDKLPVRLTDIQGHLVIKALEDYWGESRLHSNFKSGLSVVNSNIKVWIALMLNLMAQVM